MKNPFRSALISNLFSLFGFLFSVGGIWPIKLQGQKPVLFSVEVNKRLVPCTDSSAILEKGVWYSVRSLSPGQASLLFENGGEDTVVLENVVPMGADSGHVYITGLGDHPLSRTHLFRPGCMPVNVICPDNAWELGFSAKEEKDGNNRCALARRIRESIRKGQRRRFETILYPGGSVEYRVWTENYRGPWQEGLRIMFREHLLFDLPDGFDNRLYQRKDLQWIRHAYVMHLMQAWDKFFYDPSDKKFHLDEFMRRGKKLYGGDEVIGIWPTWPSLGLDQRNQFDLFRDLPGGTSRLRAMGEQMRSQGTRLFICYNPWDESTRPEDHLAGMSRLIKETTADGVVLDTRGSSSREFQEAADKVRPGVIMYSEGMAIPKDMPGIVAGRVHNALYYPPLLNLNKFIKPEFAIFRVAELYKEPIRREFATSFFNGYGTELNIFAPGQPAWVEEQYKYLGRTSRILRENTSLFTSQGFIPLIPTRSDSLWVNRWESGDKLLYTVYSVVPQGYAGRLFRVEPKDKTHWVDIWHHRLLKPVEENGDWWIEAETGAFDKKWLGTNNEGDVDCIARLPKWINAALYGDELTIDADQGTEIRIWAGPPAYDKEPLRLKPGKHTIRLSEYFGRYEGDFIIQLFNGGELLDETIQSVIPGTPRKISRVQKTAIRSSGPSMVGIPTGKFLFKESHGDDFIPYPRQGVDSLFSMPSFYMDRFPVTNAEFKKFMDATRYRPADTVNFLKHWKGGKIPQGQERYPVVYVSYEDARAYARWAGKRLPSETEWQYAAQTEALNEWPWEQERPIEPVEEKITETLTLISLKGIDSSLCNLGSGQPYAVGSYPKGANPFGLQDLVGCVWQLTNDEYMNGSYRYIIMKGGSYYRPSGSWWYVQGGPRELHYRQYLLRVSPGFERNATVGFRCVRDGE